MRQGSDALGGLEPTWGCLHSVLHCSGVLCSTCVQDVYTIMCIHIRTSCYSYLYMYGGFECESHYTAMSACICIDGRARDRADFILGICVVCIFAVCHVP